MSTQQLNDNVTDPKHYQVFPGVEAIQLIAKALTPSQFYGYCLGNCMKYRLRAGKKGDTEEDLRKAEFYKELYENHVHLCRK